MNETLTITAYEPELASDQSIGLMEGLGGFRPYGCDRTDEIDDTPLPLRTDYETESHEIRTS